MKTTNNMSEKNDINEVEEITTEQGTLNGIEELVNDGIKENTEILANMTSVHTETKEWYEATYAKEFYEALYKKFFARSYVTEASERLENVKNWIKDHKYRYELVLEACNYQMKQADEIEAYEKNYLCESILDEFFKAVEIKKEKKEITKEEQSERISSLLDEIDDFEKTEEERTENEKNKSKEEEKIVLATLSERIQHLYNNIVEFAKKKDQEEDGILLSYVEEQFNPETTDLDQENLYLNLKAINLLKKFDIIDWDFDTAMQEVNSDEYNLAMSHWQEIMSEDVDEDEKYFKVIEKNFTYGFYSTLIKELAQKADRTAITQKNLRTYNLLADEEDGERELTMYEYLIDNLEKKSKDNSIIVVTPDMVEHMDIDHKNENESIGDAHIKYIGEWKSRKVFSIEAENFKMTQGLKYFVFFIKDGNKYIFNPEKPIMYYHIIDNPFLEKPIIKLFTNCSLKFYMANTTLMSVELDD
jgi:hypothetical protein